ncbi:MAG: rubrerythrin [Oscillospiraceae bacterium]|nr:rubrerythrin [Oscillospiraceae bacterium]
MEQNNQSPHPSPGYGQCGSDREVFERVWRRVMPEPRPDCPIVLLSEEEAQAVATTLGLEGPQPPAIPCTQSAPENAVPTSEQDVPLLGAASAVYGSLLQSMIAAEMLTFRRYRALSRRLQGNAAKTVAAIAADERRHAKRLSTAYFLISGVRYLPSDAPLPSRGEVVPTGALRLHFADEQRSEALYRSSAAECSDPCLTALFEELAEEEANHRKAIITLLEQM